MWWCHAGTSLIGPEPHRHLFWETPYRHVAGKTSETPRTFQFRIHRKPSASVVNWHHFRRLHSWICSSFSVAAPSAWNRLPSHIRTSSTYTLFLTRLKTHLFAESLLWHCYAVVFSLYFWRPRALDWGAIASSCWLIDWLIDWYS